MALNHVRFNPTILDEKEYYSLLAAEVKRTHAGGRVLLTTMGFDPQEPLVKPLVRELVAAGKRGVHVFLGIDALTFLLNGKTNHLGPLFYHTDLPASLTQEFQTRLDPLHALARTGSGNYAILNMPKRPLSNIFKGRSHIKAGIINDTVYLGGCNLIYTHKQDFVLRWHDSRTADWLYNVLTILCKTGNTRLALKKSLRFDVTPHTEILIEGGHKNQSLIYQKSLELVDEATSTILLTSQFVPSGELVRRLYKAHLRGVHVAAYYNHPRIHGSFYTPWQQLKKWQYQRYSQAGIFHELPSTRPMLHAKVLASEKAAMIGSHNYLALGVKWQTAEATLLSHERDFIQQLTQIVLNRLQADTRDS